MRPGNWAVGKAAGRALRPAPLLPKEPRERAGRHIALACAFLLVAAHVPAAQGGIANTHHDIRRYLEEEDACLVCHGRESTVNYGVLEDDLGRVGGLCLFTCHSGKGLLPETDTLVPKPGPSVDIEDYSTESRPDYTAVFFTKAHGRKPSNLKDGSGQPVPWPPTQAPWPGVAADRSLECTSCHDVHNNTYAPFLRAPLAATFPDINGLCDRCHPERATNNMTGPPDGNHPVDFFVGRGAAAQRGNRGRHPRRIAIQKYGDATGTGTVAVFDVPNPSPQALGSLGESWSMGGHLASGPDKGMSDWTGEGTQQMGCYTCHSAHRPNLRGETSLLVIAPADPKRGWNPLCAGCHGDATTLEGDRADWNVGMTNFGHPAGSGTAPDSQGYYTTSVGGFQFRIAQVAFEPNRQPSNMFGEKGQILCTTCHKVHFGSPATMALAKIGQGTKAICKACHNGVGIPNENDLLKGGTVTTGHNKANSHHVTATRVVLGGEHLPANEPWGILYIQKPSWADDFTGLGKIDEGMDCADCHIFNGTAHNW